MNTIYITLSPVHSCICHRVWTEPSLKLFALQSCLSETLSKEVLALISSAMTSVTAHRNHHLAINHIISENLLEGVGKLCKVVSLNKSLLNQRRFNHLHRTIARFQTDSTSLVGTCQTVFGCYRNNWLNRRANNFFCQMFPAAGKSCGLNCSFKNRLSIQVKRNFTYLRLNWASLTNLV